MKIEFIKTDLHEFDEVTAQAVMVSAFRQERPFHGAAGLVDWRLCALFSRMSLDDFLTSSLGEAVMTPAYGRLNAGEVIFLGLGSSRDFGTEAMRTLGRRITGIIRGLHLTRVMIDLPGSPTTRLGHGKRMQLLLEAFRDGGLLMDQDIRVYIAENPRFYGELQSVVNRFNPRARGGRYG